MSKLYNQENKTTYDEITKIWKGPDYLPFYDKNCNLGRIAFEEMRRYASRICQISDSENTSLTYEEVRLKAIRIARNFERLGIKQNDIIGIAGRNTTYLISVVVGCFFHGCAYHALSPNHGKDTSKKLFDLTKPKIIFCDGQDLEKIKYAASDINAKIYTLKNHVNGIPTVLDLLESTGNEHNYEPAVLENGAEQTIAIISSSGTSGLPKAVTVANCNVNFTEFNFLTNDDVLYVGSTMDWISGFYNTVANIFGAKRIISDLPLTAEYYIKLLEKYKITRTTCSAPLMAALSKSKEATPEKFQNLRFLFYGGAKVAYNVIEKIQKLLKNGLIINVYTLSEFNKAISWNIDIHRKPQSVGTILAGVQVCIVDENGRRCGPNEAGEIWCSHGRHWNGYFNNKEMTDEIFDENRWFHTGDKGYFDNENYLYFIERIKEILKYQRMQYHPSEIEEIILNMPEVKNVCVFGLTCDDGDMAAAAIVFVEGSTLEANDVIEYVKNNEENSFKHLHGGCKIFKDIPKTANMKNDRKATKTLFLEG